MVMTLCGAVAGSAGCDEAVAPAPSCATFVACVRAGDAARGGEPTDVARFEAGGACWSGEVAAQRCAEACERGVARLRALDLATCPAVSP